MKIPRSLLVATASALLGGASLPATETDDRIESAAKASHVFKTYLKDDRIGAVSRDGAVVLTGTVADPSHRALAEHTVENLPGVTGVDNQLTVVGDAPPEHSDDWVAAKVRAALLFHRNVSASRTHVVVHDGVVTLRGEALGLAQLKLTAEHAGDVDGVTEVLNEMTISRKLEPAKPAAAEVIDDASITAEVRATLAAHRSTRDVRAKVQAADGVVTIQGVARNEAEKDSVTRLAADVEGVFRVVNRMTLDVPGGDRPK